MITDLSALPPRLPRPVSVGSLKPNWLAVNLVPATLSSKMPTLLSMPTGASLVGTRLMVVVAGTPTLPVRTRLVS